MATGEASESPRGSQQVNVRLTQEDFDVLQALMYLDEQRSATETLRAVIHAYLSEQAKAEEVQLALQALEARRAKKTGKLASMIRKRLESENDTA